MLDNLTNLCYNGIINKTKGNKMKSIYDYENNIKITTTPNGDRVITMNHQILTSIINHLYDAATLQEKEGLKATAEDTKKLWRTLLEKDKR